MAELIAKRLCLPQPSLVSADQILMCIDVGEQSEVRTMPQSINKAPGKITMANPRKIYRRADNGQITTKEYAEKHPKTTVKESVKVPRKSK